MTQRKRPSHSSDYPVELDDQALDAVSGTTGAFASEALGLSDIGQKLQFEINEASNIYTRASKAQSDTASKYDQSLNGIAQNIKG